MQNVSSYVVSLVLYDSWNMYFLFIFVVTDARLSILQRLIFRWPNLLHYNLLYVTDC